jgi:hypothetical protein
MGYNSSIKIAQNINKIQLQAKTNSLAKQNNSKIEINNSLREIELEFNLKRYKKNIELI